MRELQRQDDRTVSENSDPSNQECCICEQSVDDEETVPVAVDDGETQMCTFCASSLFDDGDATPGRIEIPSASLDREPDSDPGPVGIDQQPGSTTSASSVSWSPPEVSGGGVFASLLQMHALSLSLIWAIHRTNVRIAERILAEIDVEQVVTLVAVMAAMVTLVSLLG